MRNRIIIILITALITGAVAQGVMIDVGYALNEYHQNLLRRSGRRVRTKRKYQHDFLM